MTPLEAIVLALIQGVTEFLPISSSAHLILLPFLLGWEDHSLRFDVVTNAGTLLAAVIYFRADLVAALREMVGVPASGHSWHGIPRPNLRRPGLAWAVAVASVPVLVVGLLFYDWFATAARAPVLIAWTSIGFGVLLWFADRFAKQHHRLRDVTWTDAIWIGLCEALALVPGTSRSGITITAGLFRGLDRADAARFSFLLAIPVGIAALAKDLFDLSRGPLPAATELSSLLIGFVVSALSAYTVIGWLLAWLRRQGMTPFVVYRVLLGVLILALTQGT